MESGEKIIDPFGDGLRGTIRSPRCATAEEAQEIADRVAASLGLERKIVLQTDYAFAYEDSTRNVRLEVEIGHGNYHGSVDCWVFQCSAGRIGGSLKLRPKNHYRKIPAYFANDAAFLVKEVLAGEVERRLELNEAVERQRMELEKIKARVGPGREVGTIKKWFYDKQYGFFECSGMADVFVHVKNGICLA
jgi:hypothetical protein